LFEDFIRGYGYYAVFVFACIEGEVAILTAGFLCKQGLMSLQLVVFFAFLGTLLMEQCLFFVGRIYGTRLLLKYPRLAKKSSKVIEILRKYNAVFIFGSRFIYGIRNISPIVIGMARITPFKFSTLNIPAAIIWSIIVAGAGYVFADILEYTKENLKFFQIGLLIISCVVLLNLLWKRRK
jgi:membrane protein DedA with SNARE-associated domain